MEDFKGTKIEIKDFSIQCFELAKQWVAYAKSRGLQQGCHKIFEDGKMANGDRTITVYYTDNYTKVEMYGVVVIYGISNTITLPFLRPENDLMHNQKRAYEYLDELKPFINKALGKGDENEK